MVNVRPQCRNTAEKLSRRSVVLQNLRPEYDYKKVRARWAGRDKQSAPGFGDPTSQVAPLGFSKVRLS